MATLAELTEQQIETNDHLEDIKTDFKKFFADMIYQRGEMYENQRETPDETPMTDSEESDRTPIRDAMSKLFGGFSIPKIIKAAAAVAALVGALGLIKSILENPEEWMQKWDEAKRTIETSLTSFAEIALLIAGIWTSAKMLQALQLMRNIITPRGGGVPSAGTKPPLGTAPGGGFFGSKFKPGQSVSYTNSRGQSRTGNFVKNLPNGNIQLANAQGTKYSISAESVGNQPRSIRTRMLRGAGGPLAVGLGAINLGMIYGDENLTDREKNVAGAGVVTGTAGAIAGGIAGAKAGALTGVAAPALVPIFGIAGSIVGYTLAAKGGEYVADKLIDPAAAAGSGTTNIIDQSVTNHAAAPQSAPILEDTSTRAPVGSSVDYWNSSLQWTPLMVR